MSDWVSYVGPRGGRGWRNTVTGDVRYQTAMPGTREVTGGSHADSSKLDADIAEAKRLSLEFGGEPLSSWVAQLPASQQLPVMLEIIGCDMFGIVHNRERLVAISEDGVKEAAHGDANTCAISHAQRTAKGAWLIHNHPDGYRHPAESLRRAGNSFSPADITVTASCPESKGIVAVSPGYVYVVNMTDDARKKISEAALKEIQYSYLGAQFSNTNELLESATDISVSDGSGEKAVAARTAVYRMLKGISDDYRDATISKYRSELETAIASGLDSDRLIEHLESVHYHEVMQTVAKRFGLTYSAFRRVQTSTHVHA